MHIAEGLQLTIPSFIGQRVGILGITGTGKTNTSAVIIEELLTQNLPMTIVDTEGEYYGLKEQYELVVVGKSQNVDLTIGPEHAAALAQVSVERGLSLILDVSGYPKKIAQELLEAYFTELWGVCSQLKRPYEVILEEAHVWIPQDKNTPLKELLTEVALRGRKRGLGIILASQRSAKVEKDILTQVPLLFLHQVVHPIDMSVYKGLIPLPAKEVERIVNSLGNGQAVIIDNINKHKPQVVQVRKRHTFHPGATPELGEIMPPELRHVDALLLGELQHIIANAVASTRQDEKHLERRIKDLETLLSERNDKIKRQAEQIEQLSKLSVSGNITTSTPLPDTLHITEAHIDQVDVHRVNSVPIDRPIVIESEQVEHKQVTAKATVVAVTAPPVNEAKVKSLQKRLGQLDPKQYRVFKLLVEHDQAMTVEQIAAWLNIAARTAHDHIPPSGLFTIGLIERTKRGNAYVYKARLKEYLLREFPGVDVSVLTARLLT